MQPGLSPSSSAQTVIAPLQLPTRSMPPPCGLSLSSFSEGTGGRAFYQATRCDTRFSYMLSLFVASQSFGSIGKGTHT